MSVYLHGFARDEHIVDYVFSSSTGNPIPDERTWDPRTLSDQDRDLAHDIECLDMVHYDFDRALDKVQRLAKYVEFCIYRHRDESCTLSFENSICLEVDLVRCPQITHLEVCTKGEKSHLEVEFDASRISLDVPLKATGFFKLLGGETEEERARIVDLLARFMYLFYSVDVRKLDPEARELFRAAKKRSNEWKRFKNLHNIYREGEEKQDDDEEAEE
jgi:hypothetical protein